MNKHPLRKSCGFCRARKIRCSNEAICEACRKQKLDCVYDFDTYQPSKGSPAYQVNAKESSPRRIQEDEDLNMAAEWEAMFVEDFEPPTNMSPSNGWQQEISTFQRATHQTNGFASEFSYQGTRGSIGIFSLIID